MVCRILIVDDSEPFRRSAGELLARAWIRAGGCGTQWRGGAGLGVW